MYFFVQVDSGFFSYIYSERSSNDWSHHTRNGGEGVGDSQQDASVSGKEGRIEETGEHQVTNIEITREERRNIAIFHCIDIFLLI